MVQHLAMKVSVITPTFDAADCIMGCIQSVADQTYPDIEHIIMDGGSRDGLVGQVTSALPRFPGVKFWSEKDRGIYDAMNKGLERATGDYVIFLGADDRFADRGVVAKVLQAIGTERPDVVYGSVRAVGTGLLGIPDGGIYGGEFDLQRLLLKNICHQAIFYSRSMVQRAGPYNINYRFFADWDYNLRCFSMGTFKYIDVVICEYNTRGRSAGGEDNAFHAWFFEEVRRYFGLTVFNRKFRTLAGYIGFSGKLRIKQLKDKRGIIYLAAACWHSPRYLVQQLGGLGGKLLGHARG